MARKVSTITIQSPPLLHFWAVSRITTDIWLIPDCRSLKGLHSCTIWIIYIIFIVQMAVFIKNSAPCFWWLLFCSILRFFLHCYWFDINSWLYHTKNATILYKRNVTKYKPLLLYFLFIFTHIRWILQEPLGTIAAFVIYKILNLIGSSLKVHH